jgi:hypothetical protein
MEKFVSSQESFLTGETIIVSSADSVRLELVQFKSSNNAI